MSIKLDVQDSQRERIIQLIEWFEEIGIINSFDIEMEDTIPDPNDENYLAELIDGSLKHIDERNTIAIEQVEEQMKIMLNNRHQK